MSESDRPSRMAEPEWLLSKLDASLAALRADLERTSWSRDGDWNARVSAQMREIDELVAGLWSSARASSGISYIGPCSIGGCSGRLRVVGTKDGLKVRCTIDSSHSWDWQSGSKE